MKTEDNPSAFPWANDANKQYNWINRGMTLRDYFAAQAIEPSLRLSEHVEDVVERAFVAADLAYIIANAMLRVRAERTF